MLLSLISLRKYAVAARDGDIGAVHDFLFDDEFWTVRYLVVDTGRWLPGRKVLLSPRVIGAPAWHELKAPVDLTREQVQSSPDIDTNQPVSRQRQMDLHRHYGWPFYWEGAGVWPNLVAPVPPAPVAALPGKAEEETEKRDPHLRSLREITGYHIEASDGSIGHAEDLIANDTSWEIRYLVVDLHNWLPGRKVLISPEWLVGPISWAERTVKVFMTKESVRNSPEFDPGAPVNRDYEVRLCDYYGRPAYWVKPESLAAKQ
jgi:hypothetical protein